MVTDVGTAVVYGDLTKFQGERVMIGGLGGQTIPVTQMWLKRGVRHLPPWEYKVSMPKMYSGTGVIDTLYSWGGRGPTPNFNHVWVTGMVCPPKPLFITLSPLNLVGFP